LCFSNWEALPFWAKLPKTIVKLDVGMDFHLAQSFLDEADDILSIRGDFKFKEKLP